MPLTPGTLDFGENGIPLSPEYGDVFHSADGGLEQSRNVFLRGNHLPDAWQDKHRFVILETGFGLGLNFLATWEAFRKHPGQCQTLHFISVEKHPLTAANLERCHASWPELADESGQLRKQWPVLVAGYHRLSFDNGKVQLTLIFDEAEPALKQLDAKVDAIYLDGFSPAKNPAIWSPALLKQLARLSSATARLASWCVAGMVRQALQEAGFAVERKPGFGRKKERLEAIFTGSSRQERFWNREASPGRQEKSATLIGAGIAGVSLAHALTQRGWEVTLIEKHATPTQGASGNPAGVVRPQLTLDESFNGRLSRQSYLHTVKWISTLADSPIPACDFSGVLHLARNGEQAEHMQAMLAAHRYPETFARWLGQDEAGDMAGLAVSSPGLHFPHGGWLAGPRACNALMQQCGDKLIHRFSREATRLEQTGTSWQVWERDGLLAESEFLILTGAHESMQFASLPLTPVRGQITLLPDCSLPGLQIPVTREGYVLPTDHGIGNIGASFAFDDDPAPRESDQQANLQRLGSMLKRPPFFDANALPARVSFRAATPDRLPLAGQIADEGSEFPAETPLARLTRLPGLYTLSGLGARGLVWGPFLAQALAAKLDNEPWWLPQDLWQALDPARFLLRRMRRGQ